ncbi:aminodeoxychorismate synthase component I [Uliginosibacterium sp. H1]|uniref:aminodeoxychorismate synthase component I n=1 Tax=Uliginosibacterium sp. H1 TaxID=3114757 RepID=UPI002E1830C2|nr:aminodeoxychorismate synthase component I [Uliginosibacterium sp. H1]
MSAAQSPGFALFEDNLDQQRALLLHDCKTCIELRAGDDVEAFFSRLDEARADGAWLGLVARYELGYLLEPHLRPLLEGDGWLLRAWVFGRANVMEGGTLDAWWQAQLAALSPQQREAGLLGLQPERQQAQHVVQVRQVLDYIAAGDCYQVNLTFPCTARAYGDPLALYARLRAAQPVRHGAFIAHQDGWLLSRSPELFVARQGSTVQCRPMKGTAPRSPDPGTDAELGRALQASEKNRAENLMIVDLIRNDLGRLAPPGGVHVTRLFELEPYPTVFQMTSSIEAAPVNAPLRDILAALFPCGSVTGAPKLRAMEIIAELEDTPRDAYCGAVGWLAPDGDFSFNVPIRTLLLDRQRVGRLNVGSGIVADSDPAAEYAECLDKASFAGALVGELRLIETLLCEPGSRDLPRLARHLERLRRSTAELGWRYDEAGLRAALVAACAPLANGPHRVRLLLAPDGSAEVTTAPLDPLAPTQKVGLATMRLEPDDPRLRYKTTARRFYDDALREAMAAGLFDILFLNTRGELCEGARSNVVLELEDGLWTPPLDCGLLPGVMRAELLDSGRVKEKLLYEQDLRTARRIFVCNALRGLIEVGLEDVAETP